MLLTTELIRLRHRLFAFIKSAIHVISTFLILGTSLAASSATLTINAIDRGWYDDTGWHQPDNLSYGAGEEVIFRYRDFFVFDLTGVNAYTTSATINIYSPVSPDQFFDGYQSADPFETYVLYDISTDVGDLTDGSGGVSAYMDIGTGTSYGSYNVSATDNGQIVSITLNADALLDINSSGGLFAIGGSVSTLDPAPNNEIIFASSGEPSVPAPYLTLTTVPIPAAFWLFGSGFIGLVGLAMRRVNA